MFSPNILHSDLIASKLTVDDILNGPHRFARLNIKRDQLITQKQDGEYLNMETQLFLAHILENETLFDSAEAVSYFPAFRDYIVTLTSFLSENLLSYIPSSI